MPQVPKVCPHICERPFHQSLTYLGTIYGSAGPRTFKIAYNKALTLEQKTASGLIQGLNTLIENISSWAAITDGPTDDALPGVVTLEQLDEAKWAWEKSRDSVRVALKSLTSEPAQRVASIQRRSGFKLWMRSLVCFS